MSKEIKNAEIHQYHTATGGRRSNPISHFPTTLVTLYTAFGSSATSKEACNFAPSPHGGFALLERHLRKVPPPNGDASTGA
jgi:hypothetical protein